jgi:hypothetical protein
LFLLRRLKVKNPNPQRITPSILPRVIPTTIASILLVLILFGSIGDGDVGIALSGFSS